MPWQNELKYEKYIYYKYISTMKMELKHIIVIVVEISSHLAIVSVMHVINCY